MMVERSKLRPVNLSKEDASKAIFRERKNLGASMVSFSHYFINFMLNTMHLFIGGHSTYGDGHGSYVRKRRRS